MTWEELAKEATAGDMAQVYELLIAMARALDASGIEIQEIN